MGITCVDTRVGDSRYLDKDFPSLKADAVLVDPPCSALGVRPKIYDTTTHRKVTIVAEYQRQFLETAARILKPEGRIIYSTCTMTFEECEMQIASVCEKYKLIVERQKFNLGSPGFGRFRQGVDCQRFHPHLHDTPGFFIGLLRKTRR
jgi:16S rRNA (cytosine967-C5)-methyltransferase